MNLSTHKFLSGLKNSVYNKRHKFIAVYSKSNVKIANLLLKKGYISSFEVNNKKTISVFLNHNDYALPTISELTIVSKSERVIKFKKTRYDYSTNLLASSFFRAQNLKQNYGELAFILR